MKKSAWFGETNRPTQTVITIACISRILVWFFSYASHSIIKDYDSSSELLFAHLPESAIFSFFGHFVKWDAVYFLGVAENAYKCEQFFAFMPGFPALIKLGALGLYTLSAETLNWKACLVLSGFLITNVSFVCSAVALFWASSLITKESKEALLIATLYCLSPANVFLSAIYTESLFCLLTFLGFYYYLSSAHWKAACMFFLCSWVRSNALLYVGFVTWHGLVSILQNYHAGSAKMLIIVGVTCAQAFLVVIPYVAVQLYGYQVYCTQESLSQWCNNTIPHIYSYVQSHYWNQGFLRYWQLKQVPNFLIALPTVLITTLGAVSYFSKTWKLMRNNPNFIFEWLRKPVTSDGFHQQNPTVFVIIAYWFCFMIFCMLNFHVQTITRFFTSVPVYYWYAATLFHHRNNKGKLLLFYFLMYNIIGITLFSNFYPWT
mmetsp:Transcript_26375/g.37135  ORF Transcript_26375/g.37135 Transcript_26375/m.37135 type:complete len:432 (+) Transcript_26375:134-1429(+)